ncbi:hypothetical protein Celaphus_00008871, partial [Cervus elaphus hippelaphus]
MARSPGAAEVGRPQGHPLVCPSPKGSSGIPVKLVTNLFNLDLPQDWQLYQYHVTYSPDIESRRLRIALLYSHRELSNKAKAFDGVILFLSQKLEEKVTELSSETQRGKTVKMTITLTRELPASSPVCIQVFNIIFKKILKKLSMYQIGRNFYKPSEPVEIPQHKLSLWPGFAISVSHFESKLLLSADVSYKILRNETVLEFMTDLCHKTSVSCFTETCEKQLIGLIVLTREGKQYDITLCDLNQPVLVSLLKNKKNDNAEVPMAHLIPELCFLTGMPGQATSDVQLMKAVAEETRLNPLVRQQHLARLADDFQRLPLRLGPCLASCVTALEAWLGPGVLCQPASAADWSKDIRTCKVLSAQSLNKWLVICSNRAESVTENFLNCLRRVGSPVGFNVDRPKIIKVQENPAAFIHAIQKHVKYEVQLVLCVLPSMQTSYYDSIKKYLSSDCPVPSQCVLAQTLNKQGMMMSVTTKIAMQMICKLGGELWAVEIPGPLQRPLVPWMEHLPPTLRELGERAEPLKSLMVVGINVCKDAFSKETVVVGFVASINPRITRWFSRCILQRTTAHVADCLKVFMIGTKLKQWGWYKHNHGLPARIIVYRDGVGDGQLKTLVDYEVPQLLSSGLISIPAPCQYARKLTFLVAQSLHKEPSLELANSLFYLPKLSVIVVRKKGMPRFLAETGRTLQNPPLGTFVDSEATRPEWQVAFRGTVNPTYYNVIYDDNGLKPDHMQRLTFKLCHLYYNWMPCVPHLCEKHPAVRNRLLDFALDPSFALTFPRLARKHVPGPNLLKLIIREEAGSVGNITWQLEP